MRHNVVCHRFVCEVVTALSDPDETTHTRWNLYELHLYPVVGTVLSLVTAFYEPRSDWLHWGGSCGLKQDGIRLIKNRLIVQSV